MSNDSYHEVLFRTIPDFRRTFEAIDYNEWVEVDPVYYSALTQFCRAITKHEYLTKVKQRNRRVYIIKEMKETSW